MLGIVPTWGNIVVYITSYFRLFDPSLSLSQTFLVFPMTLSMAALAMQLGSVLLDCLHPRVHLLLGGSIFVVSIFISSFMQDFYWFLLFYAVLTGIGYGIIYMLPLKSAWTFFTATYINPYNEAPSLFINVGSTMEVLYNDQSGPVKNVRGMLQTVFFFELTIFLTAVMFMNKKKII